MTVGAFHLPEAAGRPPAGGFVSGVRGLVAEARGLGLIAALELTDPQVGPALQAHLLAEGIITDYRKHCQCLRFFPPYIIEPEEVTWSVEAIDKGLQIIEKGD